MRLRRHHQIDIPVHQRFFRPRRIRGRNNQIAQNNQRLVLVLIQKHRLPIRDIQFLRRIHPTLRRRQLRLLFPRTLQPRRPPPLRPPPPPPPPPPLPPPRPRHSSPPPTPAS